MTYSKCFTLGITCGLLGLLGWGCGKSDSTDKGSTPSATGGTGDSSAASDLLFDPEQGKFTLRAPGNLTEGHSAGPGNRTFTLKTPALTYTISYTETRLESDAAPDRVDKFLNAEVSALQLENDCKLIGDPKTMEIAGAPGKEVELEMKDKSHRRIQFIASGGRLYRLEVAGTGEAVISADAERFLHSFKLSR